MEDLIDGYLALEKEDRDTIENLVDWHGLDNVIDALADVCAEKAKHIRTNWQDMETAKHWDRASYAVNSSLGIVIDGVRVINHVSIR
jgi:hypothetical protein|tara:strand:- start:78 stop:338 length:261 start_codon:yes stop_codon:yes gene_type:complete